MGKASRSKHQRRSPGPSSTQTPVFDRFVEVRDASAIQSIEELRNEDGPTKVLVRGLYLPPKTYSMHESRIKFAREAAKRRWFEEHPAAPRNAILEIQILEAPSQNPISLMKTEMKEGMRVRTNWRMFGGRRWGKTQAEKEAETDGST